MLLAGPQVVHEYSEKYQHYASDIASKLKGDAIVRDPQLVFLGTTSVFARSSQYNRIRIPTPTGDKVRLEDFGLTKGYGSVHFSADTRTHLNALLAHTNAARLINNRFGEGVNPKLRRVSAGLAAVGIANVSSFTKHRSKRIVYGLPLCSNTYAYLRGETAEPHYYFPTENACQRETAMEAICEFWRSRWLSNRITNKGFDQLEKVKSFKKKDLLLSQIEFEKEGMSDQSNASKP